MMRSGNPVLSDNVLNNVGAYSGTDSMSIQGTVNKSFLLLFLVGMGSSWAWGNPQQSAVLTFPAVFIGFIIAMVTVFKKEWSPVTAPLYALVEGVVLGTVSLYMETLYPGIVMQAVGLTFGTLCSMLIGYKSGMIKVTENFRAAIISATGGIFLVYFLSIVLGFFGIQIPLIHGSGPVGILFSLFVVGIAAFNLVLDFDLIENASRQGAPKYMEWFGSFALMVTLIWLYMEILRLLAKLRRR